MKTRKNLFILIAVVALSLVAFTGSVFAQDDTPTDEAADSSWTAQMQQHMEERFGAGAWEEMLARMTERHGEEWVAEHLQSMEENGCPMMEDGEGTGPMMRGPMWDDEAGSVQNWGRNMMHRFFGNDDAEFTPGQGMMGGRGMMGRGMMGQGMMHGEDAPQHHMGGRSMWGNGQ